MNLELYSNFARPIFAIALAGLAYIADTIQNQIPGVPTWLSELGLPVAFLVVVVYALISIHKALRESERGRRLDWENYAQKLETMIERGNKTREDLMDEFKALADELRRRDREHH